MSDVNSILKKIASLKGFDNARLKGDAGEEATIEIVKDIATEIQNDNPDFKCAVWQSVKYQLACDSQGNELPANFKLTNIGLTQSKSGNIGEIDVFLATPYGIFIIEVKTYNAFVLVNDDWTYKGKTANSLKANDWCNLCQVEKSARHMYYNMLPIIPDGDQSYIHPVLVYSQGKIKVDTKDYTVTTLNGLKNKIFGIIDKFNKTYTIDVDEVINYISTKTTAERRF